MTNYAPTTASGDQRRRARFIGIYLPLGQLPRVEILEQEVIRTTSGERVLEDLGAVPVGTFNPDETFPVRDPETDAELGGTATVGQAMALVYSWVRAQQLARDTAAEIALTAQIALAGNDNGASVETTTATTTTIPNGAIL